MRVLGIDPGCTVTGYGVVEQNANEIRHINNGIVRPNPRCKLPRRLQIIYEELTRLIEEYRPDVAVIENVFVAKNAQSSLILGHARGAAMLAASASNIEIAEYTPSEVKQAVVGNGRADKNQVQQMSKTILGLPEIACEDASDALAVAICHCHSAGLKQRLEKSVKRET